MGPGASSTQAQCLTPRAKAEPRPPCLLTFSITSSFRCYTLASRATARAWSSTAKPRLPAGIFPFAFYLTGHRETESGGERDSCKPASPLVKRPHYRWGAGALPQFLAEYSAQTTSRERKRPSQQSAQLVPQASAPSRIADNRLPLSATARFGHSVWGKCRVCGVSA